MKGKGKLSHSKKKQGLNEGGKPVSSGVDKAKNVTVLTTAKKERFAKRSNQPDVKSLLNTEVVEEDAENEWGVNQTKLSLKAVLVLLVVIMLSAVGLLLYTKNDEEGAQSISLSDDESSRLAVSAINQEKEALSDLAKMERCIEGYLSAETVIGKNKFCRHAERVKPLMDHYYRDRVMKAVSYKWLADLKPLVLDGESFNFARIITSQGGAENLLLEKVDDAYKVDWESGVCYLPVAWDEFLEKPHTEPLNMRVFAETANVFLGDFSDDEKYHCYRLSTRDFEGFIYAYVEQASEAGLKMQEMINIAKALGDKNPQAMMLHLTSVKGGGGKNVAVIHSFISPRWSYVEDL